ncbi:MAG TPA: hypothetical protein VGD16_05125 [Enterovirga sp.]
MHSDRALHPYRAGSFPARFWRDRRKWAWRPGAGQQRPKAVRKAETTRKLRLSDFVLSNCTWEDGEVVATFRHPFDMLAETATAAAGLEGGESAKSSKSAIWLGDEDSNLD